MHELWSFLAKFFSDQRRFAAAITILIALPFAFGWASSIGYNNGFDAVQIVYGMVVLPLTAVSAWLLLVSPRLEQRLSKSLRMRHYH